MKNRSAASLLSFADSFTIVNGLLGLFSIFLAVSREMEWASSFILLAVLADGVDGVVARKLGSSIGKYMDEFSDMVSFCVAPLIIVYIFYSASFEITGRSIAILFSCGLFLFGGMLHLIRYHIGDEKYFVGLTTPAAAMAVIAVASFSIQWWYMAVIMFALSLLMMSSIPYPKIEGIISVPAVTVILLAVAFGNELYLLLFGGVALYIVLGPVYVSHKTKTFTVSD